MSSQQKILTEYIRSHSGEVASFLEDIEDVEIAAFLQEISIELSAVLLSNMDRYKAAGSLEKLKIGTAIQVVGLMPESAAELLLRLIEPELCESILDGLPQKKSQLFQRILKFQQNTVGAFLTPVVFTLNEEISVSQALSKIQKSKPTLISHIYILNRSQTLVGSIGLKDLLTSDGLKKISAIMNPEPLSILANMDISQFIEMYNNKDSFSDLAVVDTDGVFLGIISRDAFDKLTLKKNMPNKDVIQTGAALGELFKIGLASFLYSTGELVKNNKS